MTWVLALLIVQAVLGGFDVLWNHEYKERLPHWPLAALEQKIHGARELLYGGIFFALAFAEWHGLWAGALILVLLIELLLTACDFVVEDRTRKLAAVERVPHLLLSVNGGAYLALLAPLLASWLSEPDRIVAVDYGLPSTVLGVFGLAVLGWGVRDLAAGFRPAPNPADEPSNAGGRP